MATFDDVKAVVVEQLSIDADAVKMESKIIEDLGADSLDVVELIMALEEKFEVEIPDSDAEKLIKIEDVVNYIENLKNNLKNSLYKELVLEKSCSNRYWYDQCLGFR